MITCLGCARTFNLRPPFALTCPCGSHVFQEGEQLFIPASLSQCLMQRTQENGRLVVPEMPHLDYLVGTSSYSSPMKTLFIQMIERLGGKWMKDCEQCQKDGTLQKEQEREAHLATEEAERIMRQRSGG